MQTLSSVRFGHAAPQFAGKKEATPATDKITASVHLAALKKGDADNVALTPARMTESEAAREALKATAKLANGVHVTGLDVLRMLSETRFNAKVLGNLLPHETKDGILQKLLPGTDQEMRASLQTTLDGLENAGLVTYHLQRGFVWDRAGYVPSELGKGILQKTAG